MLLPEASIAQQQRRSQNETTRTIEVESGNGGGLEPPSNDYESFALTN